MGSPDLHAGCGRENDLEFSPTAPGNQDHGHGFEGDEVRETLFDSGVRQ
jgi:hypothetical protein